VSRIWRPASSDPVAYSASNTPHAEGPIHAGAPIVQQTRQHLPAVQGRAEPSIQHKARIQPSTETSAPMVLRRPTCQMASAAGAASATCARR
jgi:hypothetical protein